LGFYSRSCCVDQAAGSFFMWISHLDLHRFLRNSLTLLISIFIEKKSVHTIPVICGCPVKLSLDEITNCKSLWIRLSGKWQNGQIFFCHSRHKITQYMSQYMSIYVTGVNIWVMTVLWPYYDKLSAVMTYFDMVMTVLWHWVSSKVLPFAVCMVFTLKSIYSGY
jgi:hypothetical protein